MTTSNCKISENTFDLKFDDDDDDDDKIFSKIFLCSASSLSTSFFDLWLPQRRLLSNSDDDNLQ